MKNVSYYETIASFYDIIVPRNVRGICDSLEATIGRYGKSKRILDLGCGTGRFTIELAKRGFSMLGLDLTDEMIGIAQKNAKKVDVNVKFIKEDIRNFRLKKKIGVIWARGSIGDIVNLNDVKRAFKNIRNNLLKKGIFIFDVRDFSSYIGRYKDELRSESRVFKNRHTITNFNLSAKLNKRTKIERMTGEIIIQRGRCIRRYEVNHALRYYTQKGITALLNNAGFNILEIQQGGYEFDKDRKPQYVVVVEK
ncbi:MAG: class I SAM-dependent methyltransferase [candidate division WOR-3 bacterium]|nr:MAG: class I SAM-dependent methyltransferase [candidate division WOR-3 bacterium]